MAREQGPEDSSTARRPCSRVDERDADRAWSGRGSGRGIRRGRGGRYPPSPASPAGPPAFAPEPEGQRKVAFREGNQRPDDEGVGGTMERAGSLRAGAGFRFPAALERRERPPPVTIRSLLDGHHPAEIGPASMADGRCSPAPGPARRAAGHPGRFARLASWTGLPEGLRFRPSSQVSRERFRAPGSPALGAGRQPCDCRRGPEPRPPGKSARSLLPTHVLRSEAPPHYSR